MLFCAQSEIADNQRPLAPAGLQYVLARLLYQKSERNANVIKPGDIFFPFWSFDFTFDRIAEINRRGGLDCIPSACAYLIRPCMYKQLS